MYRAWIKIGEQLGSVRVEANNKEEVKQILKESSPSAVIGLIEKIEK